MKYFRRILIVVVLAVVAALGIIFWPKFREAWDRWLTGEKGPEKPA